jgi:Uma2 family endonuclease
MAKAEPARATLADLHRYEGKAELIGGRIVPLMAAGRKPHRIGRRITRSLEYHAEKNPGAEAYGDKMGFAVPMLPSGRESFSPDATYHDGPFPENEMRLIDGAPRFAAEVRSENDYGLAAEIEMEEKRADYFQAGTQVVWDVDSANECVYVYRYTDPSTSVAYRRGQVAEAEPAVSGWTIAVDEIFR